MPYIKTILKIIFMRINKFTTIIFLGLMFLVAFLFRVEPLVNQRPLWIDEFCSVTESIRIQDGHENIEDNNYLTHYIILISRLLFGEITYSYIFPFVFIGSLTVVLLYIFSKKHFGTTTAVCSSLLLSTSYFQIAWSNQARGYVLQQLLSLIFLLIFFKKKINPHLRIVLLILVSILGIMTHKLFILLLSSAVLFYIYENSKNLKNILDISNLKKIIIFLIPLLAIIIFTDFINTFLLSLKYGFLSFHNNFWYYKNFLWNQQTLVSVLSFSGLIIALLNKRSKRVSKFIVIYFLIHFTFITFIFGHHMTKYVLPLYVYLLLFVAYAIQNFSEEIIVKIKLKNQNFSKILALVFTLGIIFLGDNFVRKPQEYYSVNKDMREIAVVDYDKVYEKINAKKKIYGEQNIALIDTWGCRINYYNGFNKENLYWFRWIDSGFRKSTLFTLNENEEKLIVSTGNPEIKLIGELSDLEKAMTKYEYGFLWIDDTSLPQDVQDYAKDNFYKELYIESYEPEILENPYSIWPATLYSWGFETPNPYYSKPTQDRLE